MTIAKPIIDSWIAWAREHLPTEESIPLIGNSELDPPWLDEIWETFEYSNPSERSAMRVEFERLLVLNLGDIAVRFPILDYYYNLVRCYSTQKEEHVSETRSAFREDMAYLVKLETLDGYTSWRELSWEIVNGCVAGAWDFSDRAFGKAFEHRVLDQGIFQALRGQYNFLVCFRSEVAEDILADFQKVLGVAISVEPDIWDPHLLATTEPAKALLGVAFFRTCISVFRKASCLNQDQIERLRYAISDLESAIARLPDLFVGYRAMLAKCYFGIEDQHAAARHYESIAKSNPSVPVYRSLATCYRLSNQPMKARQTLEACLGEFPHEKGIHLEMAELEAQEGNVHKAIAELRTEIDTNPEIDRDWRISALLALGETHEVSAKLLIELKSDKETYEPIKSVLTEYWKPFKHLEEQAREMWIFGTLLLHFNSSDPKIRSKRDRLAAAEFAKAVEVVLLRAVFSNFRDYVKKTPEVDQMAKQGLESPEFGNFSKFLVWKDAPISLGQMLYVVAHCEDLGDSVFRRFGIWAQQHHPNLTAMMQELDIINRFRRPEAHGKKATSDPHTVRDLCREVIEALIAFT